MGNEAASSQQGSCRDLKRRHTPTSPTKPLLHWSFEWVSSSKAILFCQVIREVARSQRSPSLIPSVTQKSLLIIINNPIYVFINCHPPEKDWLKPCRYLISSFKLIGHSPWNTEDVHVHTSKLGNKNARWEKLSVQVTFQSERILTLSLWPQQSHHTSPLLVVWLTNQSYGKGK